MIKRAGKNWRDRPRRNDRNGGPYERSPNEILVAQPERRAAMSDLRDTSARTCQLAVRMRACMIHPSPALRAFFLEPYRRHPITDQLCRRSRTAIAARGHTPNRRSSSHGLQVRIGRPQSTLLPRSCSSGRRSSSASPAGRRRRLSRSST